VTRFLLALTLIASLGLSFHLTAARGDNWPEFRGPTGQGIVRDAPLPTEWSDTKNVVWKQPIPGLGWSSPIILNGRIYLTTAVPDEKTKDQSLRAMCLDAQTGKVIWDKEVFKQNGKTAPKIHGKNSHASPTPLTDGQRIYVHFGHDGTAALDLDGKILWTQTSLKYKPVHGNGGMPVLVDDLLVFSCDGGDKQFVVALDKSSGKVAWQTKRDADAGKKFSFSTGLLITVNGQKQVVLPGAGAVCAYDAKDGKEIWRVNYGDGYSVVPRPVAGHGMVFLSSGYDSPKLYAIRTDGTGTVSKSHVAWTLDKGAPLTPSPLLVGDEVYVISDQGIASCLDAKTGKLHWQERVGGAHSSSPIFADGKIYFLSEQGVGTVIKADKKFEIISRNPMNEKTLASYAASDGALFVRTEKNLYRIGSK
jgi:outer membrane protein assembly factor BamB